MKFRIQCILFILGLVIISLKGQIPFTCEGQVWIVQPDDALVQLSVGTNNGIRTTLIKDNIGEQSLAMGFRNTDRMLYAIHPLSHELFRIDATGNLETIATPNVNSGLVYLAGDITADGNSFVLVGSDNGLDARLVVINLESGNYEVEETSFSNGTLTRDIAFHPGSGLMYGFDGLSRSFYTHNLGGSLIDIKSPVFTEHNVDGIYFDAFGDMFGFGTAFFGVISGLFEVDQVTGDTELISTSGLIPINDMAACPSSLEFKSKVTPEVAFPCSDLTFEYTFANQTGTTIDNVILEHELPIGYTFNELGNIPFSGVLDNTTPDNFLRIENLKIPSGVRSFSVSAYVDDIPGGLYKSQAILNNISSNFGSFVLSNDPTSAATEDSTRMEVNRIDEDSLSFTPFVCKGSSVTLDASDYGANLTWSNGQSSAQIEVSQTGLITLTAASGCQELIVNYDVVSATCPFTVKLGHLIFPDTLVGCSQATFRYILENDSGEQRNQITIVDTLPAGFTFIELINNPYESELSPNLPSNIFQLEKLVLLEGIDTIDILVEVGDIEPGTFHNEATMKGLPQVLGPLRFSDDPSSLPFPDSTAFYLRGVPGDSLSIDTLLCLGVDLVLDVSRFGDSFLWEDGSTNDQFIAKEAGGYAVLIMTGCDTALVTYHIEEADLIQVNFSNDKHSIHQGESILLQTNIKNTGDSISINWDDAMTNSLSCFDCPTPLASPLSNTIYTIAVENEQCIDTALIEIFVDDTRRVYIPNAFSPNKDGINDFFYFQSPDPGSVLSFQVFDRWGNLVFEANDIPFNLEQAGWDGKVKGIAGQTGVYIWQATVEFVDGKIENWSGNISVMK